MSYRIFMNVNRGMTDATPVCVFPWEEPLMQELHGEAAQRVSIDEMCAIRGAKSVQTIKLPVSVKMKKKAELPPDTRGQLVAMCIVPDDTDPKHNIAGEYARLEQKYGMHPKINLTVVGKVFGSPRQFRQTIKPFLGPKPPKNDSFSDDDIDVEEPTELSYAEMDAKQLKAKFKEAGVAYPPRASVNELRDLAVTAFA